MSLENKVEITMMKIKNALNEHLPQNQVINVSVAEKYLECAEKMMRYCSEEIGDEWFAVGVPEEYFDARSVPLHFEMMSLPIRDAQSLETIHHCFSLADVSEILPMGDGIAIDFTFKGLYVAE